LTHSLNYTPASAAIKCPPADLPKKNAWARQFILVTMVQKLIKRLSQLFDDTGLFSRYCPVFGDGQSEAWKRCRLIVLKRNLEWDYAWIECGDGRAEGGNGGWFKRNWVDAWFHVELANWKSWGVQQSTKFVATIGAFKLEVLRSPLIKKPSCQ
jgi:hypothetical protein